MAPSRHTSEVLFFLLLYSLATPCAAICYQPEAVAGIVIATFVITAVLAVLIVTAVWYLRRRREEKANEPTPPADTGPPGQFAFDNPYFREHDDDEGNANPPEKGKSTTKGSAMSIFAFKHSDMSVKGKKYRTAKGHPFNTMFSTGKKQRAMDDSCLAVEPERTVVSLRGHDFTGLGFNICGNMRDGILVKDVLHRGPASESGKIKAGDRIISVTVSFTSMVYEDALTILSYASPYDVQLELERPTDHSRGMEPSTPGKRLGSSSFSGNGQRLFHPLYRSQSIDDLTQIGKDTFPGHGFGPRRSQSVGVAAHKLAFHFKSNDGGSEEKSSPSTAAVSTTGSLNERMLACAMMDGGLKRCAPMWEKKFEDSLESDEVPAASSGSSTQRQSKPGKSPSKKSKSPATDPKKLGKERSISSESEKSDSFDESSSNKTPLSSSSRADSTKQDDSGKRRAPLPPGSAVSIKTKAQVHHHGYPKQGTTGHKNGGHAPETNDSTRWGSLNQSHRNESSSSVSDQDSSNGFRQRLEGSYSSITVRSPSAGGCKNGQNCGECDSDLSGDSLDQEGHKSKLAAPRHVSPSGNFAKVEEAVNENYADRSTEQRSAYLESQVQQQHGEGYGEDKSPVVDEQAFNKWEYRNSWNNLEKKRDPINDSQTALASSNTSAMSVIRVSDRDGKSERSFNHPPGSPKFSSKNAKGKSKIKHEIKESLDTPSKDPTSASMRKSNNSQKAFQPDHSINNGLSSDYVHQYVGQPQFQNSTFFHSGNSRDNGCPMSTVVISNAHPVVKYPEKKLDSSVHSRATSNPQKEVIEISQHELDGVMMSHRQFLMKQANAGGMYGNPNAPRQRTNMDFEAWKFVGDGKRDSGRPANGSAIHSSVYQRAGNQGTFDSSGRQLGKKDVAPDISSHNAKHPESGLAKSVIISTFDNSSGRSSLRLTSMDMPPAYLEHK